METICRMPIREEAIWEEGEQNEFRQSQQLISRKGKPRTTISSLVYAQLRYESMCDPTEGRGRRVHLRRYLL